MSETKKWTNTAGPRKSKKVRQILDAIKRVSQEHVEISGTGEGSRTVYWSFCEPANDAALAQIELLGDTFGWEITNANLEELERTALVTLNVCKTLRPVVDKRRSNDEEQAMQARRTDMQIAADANKRACEAAIAGIEAKRPVWAKAIIIAELEEDQSDSMSDYHGSKTVRTVVIGWRKGDREDFKQLRAAAATFPETAHMGPGCDDVTVSIYAEPHKGPNAFTERHAWEDETGNVRRFSTRDAAEKAITDAVDANRAARNTVPFVPYAFDAIDYAREFGWEIVVKDFEHRDTYSLGKGLWLGRDRYSGWTVQSVRSLRNWGVITEDGLPRDAC